MSWLALLQTIFGIALLIAVHELGHYLAARAVGIPIWTFSVGFGRALVGLYPQPDGRRKVVFGREPADQFEVDERSLPIRTSVVLRALPFGGSVMPDVRSLTDTTPLRRLAFYVGGAAANLVTFAALLTVITCIGARTVVDGKTHYYGMDATHFVVEDPAIKVMRLREDGPAYAAGLLPGDTIFAVNGYPVANSTEAADRLGSLGADGLVRAGVQHEDGTFADIAWEDAGADADGIGLSNTAQVSLHPASVPSAFAIFLARTPAFAWESLCALSTLFDHESAVRLSGPVGIVRWMVAVSGWSAFLSVLANLSLSLAVMNLLPIPMLDGGRVVYALCEFVSRRRIPTKIQNRLDGAFACALIVLAVFITGRDIVNWITGAAP